MPTTVNWVEFPQDLPPVRFASFTDALPVIASAGFGALSTRFPAVRSRQRVSDVLSKIPALLVLDRRVSAASAANGD